MPDGTLSRVFTGFVSVSALQAVANYGTYLLLLIVAPWWIAFLGAAIAGITLQTVLQMRWTFRGPTSVARGWRYVVFQIGYLAVFAGALALVIAMGVPAALGPLLVLAVLTPINFLITRRLLSPADPGA